MKQTLFPLAALAPGALLVACGSATGELPVTPSASREPVVFADPFATVPENGAVPTGTTQGAEALPGATIPSPSPSPSTTELPSAFADGGTEDSAAFAEPDPAAGTLLGRLGHVALRELAEPLVRGEYVAAYLDLDTAVAVVLEAAGDGSDAAVRQLGCPGGGQLDVSTEAATGSTTHAVVFERCVIDGSVLDGRLVRTALADSLRVGSNEMIEFDYDGLRVVEGGSSVTMTGTTRRSLTSQASTTCVGERTESVLAHRIETALIIRDDETTSATDADHELLREVVPSRAGTDDCREILTLTFDDDTTVTGGRLGAAGVDLTREGRIVRDARGDREPRAEAAFEIAVDDGSSLSLELLSDLDSTASATVQAEGAAVSFTTDYRFEP